MPKKEFKTYSLELERDYIDKLKKSCLVYDNTEDNHIKADMLLCDLLKKLGFEKLVEVYRKVGKWYA